MEDQKQSNQGAIIEQQGNLPHGQVEGVPSRSGVGHEEGHSRNPLDDTKTDIQRQRYGESDKFFGSDIHGDIAIENVNDIKMMSNNPTKADRIIPNTEFSGDGFYNHSCSG